jgi:hypothetical protein
MSSIYKLFSYSTHGILFAGGMQLWTLGVFDEVEQYPLYSLKKQVGLLHSLTLSPGVPKH